MERHVGWTLVTTAALGLALSILPLPDAIRPLPKLREAPKETLAALLRPRAPRKNVPVEVDWEAEAKSDELVFEPLDLTDEPSRPIEPKPLRFTVQQEAERRKWDAVIRKVGANRAPITDFCTDEACATTALTPWYEALDGLDKGKASDNVRMVVIGTSLIASDHITDTTRRLLQLRHGSGGLGFMFVDRPTRNAGRTVRTGTATEGWQIDKVTDNPPFQEAGFAGVAFTATTPQSTRFTVGGAHKLELFLMHQPGGGQIEVLGDGDLLARFDTDFKRRQLSFPELELPDGLREVTLRTKGGPVRLDGVTLEGAQPGVVLDSLGLPGASAQVLLREKADLFTEQLHARAPALVVLMIGGNDAFDISLNRYDLKQARAWGQQVIDRVKKAAPGAACLLASPPDAGSWRMDETIAPRTQTVGVGKFMRELAKENGCAVWDMQSAMGGEGAVARWWEAGLMNRDLVHPYALGGDVLGYLFESALEEARTDYRKKRVTNRKGQKGPAVARPVIAERPVASGADAGVAGDADYLTRPEGLVPFFAKLKALETSRSGRVAVMQLGASHTAANFFTDEARRLLGARFGSIGRGYLPAGKPSPRLDAAGVGRRLVGPWRLDDAMQQRISGFPWGLTGIRASAAPGAQLVMTFEESPPANDATSRLQLYYWKEDDQPAPEVTIDGTVVPIVEYAGPDAGVRVLDFAAPGSRHEVIAKNVSSENMAFFGMSHELMQPGIVYDSVGLFGATASVIAEYDQVALAQQIAVRQPDLFVLFFGTNESRLSPAHVEEMRAAYPVLFRTLRTAAPDAACLILSPTDQVVLRKGKRPREPESIDEVIAEMKVIAEQNGCAFWATRDFMGGRGSIIRWKKDLLANRDLVHLTPAGYRKLADAMIGDVLRAYDAWSSAANGSPTAP